ncbi:MAG: ABC transporter ATP-binding protein [Lachnospiraceae bacterium]|jgi:branched-chain amino acid transport system ATP-binding protein|nr:ABC transporter ATP-binding protein [Lachnospiraceae bacterium]
MKSTGEQKSAVLKLDNVCKNFGGVTAADAICLELYRGEVFGLIGPNGAGKTTLLNLITGIYMPDKGTVILEDKNISRYPTYRRARAGIARTFQHPRLLGRCDIRTNIYMGVDLANKRKKKAADEGALSFLMESAGLGQVDLKDTVDKLSYGQQKLLEIIRAILCEPGVMLLDEPAAGLNNKEMEYVGALIKIAVEKNIAVLLIEHAMDFVMSICDRITVLNFGHQIMTGTPKEVQEDEEVIKAYLGGGNHAGR